MQFDTFLHLLPSNPLVEAVQALYEASEGDARKYMKKTLQAMGLEEELAEDYGANWSEEVFNKIRTAFVHQGCDVYFVPGIARIAYGELDYDSDDEDTQKLAEFKRLVKFITIAHKGQFTRNLEKISVVQDGPQKGMKVKSDPLTYDQLAEMFGNESRAATNSERAKFAEENGVTDNGYKIIELKNFEQAHKLLPYCTADPWCYLENETAFDSYAQSGNKLYVALAPGFEKLRPGEPGYGRSMIGFDMGPVDENGKSELCVCNNRYNHSKNLEYEEGVGSGDDAYNEIQLSKILGFPVWEKCPGYTEEELAQMDRITPTYVKARVPDVETFKRLLSSSEARVEFKEKYKLVANVPWDYDNGIEFYSVNCNYAPIISAILVDGNVLWYKDAQYLSNDRISLKLQDNTYIIVSSTGELVSGQKFNQMGHYDGCYPIRVGICKNGADDMQYNYIDYDGNLRSPIWFDAGEEFQKNSVNVMVTKDGKKNLMLPSGRLVFDTWYKQIESQRTQDRCYLVSNDGPCTVYNKYYQEIASDVKTAEKIDYDAILVTNSANKNNVINPKVGKLIFNQWFDKILPVLFGPVGADCYPVYDADKGYNLFNVSPSRPESALRPVFPTWLQKLEYLGRGLIMIGNGGKINLYQPSEETILLPEWCDDCDRLPQVHMIKFADEAETTVYALGEDNGDPVTVYTDLGKYTEGSIGEPYCISLLVDNLYLHGKPVVFFRGMLVDAEKCHPVQKPTVR